MKFGDFCHFAPVEPNFLCAKISPLKVITIQFLITALVLGSFFYGYWVLQVPGAWIAMKLGATRIFGYGVFLSSLMALITPVATRYHVFALAGVRVVQGLFLGVTYPCTIAIWAKWAPPLERSTMVTMAIAGN